MRDEVRFAKYADKRPGTGSGAGVTGRGRELEAERALALAAAPSTVAPFAHRRRSTATPSAYRVGRLSREGERWSRLPRCRLRLGVDCARSVVPTGRPLPRARTAEVVNDGKVGGTRRAFRVRAPAGLQPRRIAGPSRS